MSLMAKTKKTINFKYILQGNIIFLLTNRYDKYFF